MNEIKKLTGPILILGAGGFIGINLLQKILSERDDVFGVTHNKKTNWRFQYAKIPQKSLIQCNLTHKKQIEKLLKTISPKTIFNLSAYGAYAKQTDVEQIYTTNVVSTAILLELLRDSNFSAYIHAGSQSEYGLNAAGPKENGELIPNSHYAVSKVADSYLLKYYGKVLHLPVIHLRLYSAFGPWEEPDRLIPVLLAKARKKNLPPFVNPSISRDFIYVDDVISALIVSALNIKKSLYGEVFNVASGKKTTIKKLANLTKKQFDIKKKSQFGIMTKRKWDIINWYGNNSKLTKVFKWRPQHSLTEGLQLTVAWQEKINYDTLLKKITK